MATTIHYTEAAAWQDYREALRNISHLSPDYIAAEALAWANLQDKLNASEGGNNAANDRKSQDRQG